LLYLNLIYLWVRFQELALLQENARIWWAHIFAAVHLAMNLVKMEISVKVLFLFKNS
jgi:hypothetical protein